MMDAKSNSSWRLHLKASGALLAMFFLAQASQAADPLATIGDRVEALFRIEQASASAVLSPWLAEPGEVLVYFGARTPASVAVGTVKKAVPVTSIEKLLLPGLFLVQLSDNSPAAVRALLEDLRQADGVLHAAENSIGQGGFVPNDLLYPQQWNLDQPADYDIDASAAWDLSRGDSGNVVALLDTGLNFDHPEVLGRIALNAADPPNGVDDDENGLVDDYRGWDFVANGPNPVDTNGHGTEVAFVLAANSNNAYGMAGVDHKSRLLPVKILNDSGLGTVANLIQGLTYLTLRPEVDIVNMSIWNYPQDPLLGAVMNELNLEGKLLVACAGNSGQEDADFAFPSGHPQVFTVGWTNQAGVRSPQSSTGASLDLVAPGESILVSEAFPPYESGRFGFTSGCSFATPQVAGALSLLRARFPALTFKEVLSIAYASAQDLGFIGWDHSYGAGSLRADDLLLEAIERATIFGDGFESGDTTAWSASSPP